ncbi:hypothetical protein BD413DRAFT_180227 [Trametes elegans]|nr:hypothetical protein BD413DRAFT_180227 [Trametes elegans]
MEPYCPRVLRPLWVCHSSSSAWVLQAVVVGSWAEVPCVGTSLPVGAGIITRGTSPSAPES